LKGRVLWASWAECEPTAISAWEGAAISPTEYDA
jgi:hypothetical protein